MKPALDWVFKNKRKAATVLLVLVVAVAAYFFLPGGSAEFNKSYAEYQKVAKAQDVAAFYPSTESNEVRKDLFTILSRVLTGELSTEKRLEDAGKGLILLEQAEAQVDAMADLSAEVAAKLKNVEESNSLFVSQKTRSTVQDVVELGEKRRILIEDIRGLSYKANFYMEEIFARVIADGGVVTPAHATYLNEQIPQVEEQFDRRSALYADLQKTAAEIEARMGDFDD